MEEQKQYESAGATFSGKLKEYFKEEKAKKLIVIAGLVGIALIFLSGFIDTKAPAEQGKTQNITLTSDISAYKQEVEQSLADIVSTIEGAGTTRVMLTMDSSTELVYATDEKITEQNATDKKTGGESADQINNESQSNYLTVKLSDGTEQTVLLKEVQPKIRGVLVVCKGGEDSVIHQRVLEAVTKALNISSAKVCVTKLSE